MQLNRRHVSVAAAVLLALAGGTIVSFPNPLRHSLASIALRPIPAPVRIIGLKVLERNNCGWSEALQAPEESASERRIIERLRNTSRLVRRETGLELWETEHGPFWVLANSNMPLFFHMLAEQELGYYFQPGVTIRPGDIVLDCGANYGVFTRTALNRGAARVVAIEPVPWNVECLRKTFAAEIAAGRVVVVARGVWDSTGILTLQMDPRNSWGAHLVAARPEVGELKDQVSIPVELVRIDDLVDELRLERVDFIKMDIEGAERNALLGARKTIERFRPRMAVTVYHRPDDPVEIPKSVPWWYGRSWGHCEDWTTRFQAEVVFFW